MADPYEWRDERGERRDHFQTRPDARYADRRSAPQEPRAFDLGRDAQHERLSRYNTDPDRGGGMFGGQDRPGSLFSHHDDGLGARRRGPHTGKGPRGYARADARIREDICDRLTDDGALDASNIEVLVERGEVTLNGQVDGRASKRLAEDIAEAVSGVRHVQNNLRAKPPKTPEAQPPAHTEAAPETPPRLEAPNPGNQPGEP